jgi:hypothetical protein
MQALFDLQLNSIKALHPSQATVDQQPKLHILTGAPAGKLTDVLTPLE